jgi:hypothetical protein
MRPSGRNLDEIRDISIEIGATKHAEGSCLIKCGATQVLCTASLEERVPPFLKNTGLGWVTAEYGMLPRATHTRMRREAAAGKQSGERRKFNGLSVAPARGHRPLGVGRAADHRRLRCDPGRWRHALRLDHWGLGCAAACGEQAPEGRRHHLGPDHRSRGRRVLRDLCRPAGAGPRLCRGQRGRDGQQLRHDGGRRADRGAGQRRGRGLQPGRVRPDVRPGRQGDRSAGRAQARAVA